MEETEEPKGASVARPGPEHSPLWADTLILGAVLVSVAFLWLLGAFVLTNIVRVRGCVLPKARADVIALELALNEYAIDHQGRFPPDLMDLILPGPAGLPYLDIRTLPRDPWGHPYGYERPLPGDTRPRVFTLGSDGKPGGVGEDRDMDNLLIREGKI